MCVDKVYSEIVIILLLFLLINFVLEWFRVEGDEMNENRNLFKL